MVGEKVILGVHFEEFSEPVSFSIKKKEKRKKALLHNTYDKHVMRETGAYTTLQWTHL